MSVKSVYENNPYNKWEKSEQNLTILKSLKSAPQQERWTKYRQLSLRTMYLIGSRFHENNFTWNLKSEFKLTNAFDKALKNNLEPERVMKAIDDAILDQTKIVLLNKLRATLLDPSKTTEDKKNAYYAIKGQNFDFFDEIKHCIWVAHGKNENAGLDFSDKKIETEPSATLQINVIKEMIKVLKQGHQDLKKNWYSFAHLAK